MAVFLDAALKILHRHGEPLTARQITSAALEAGLLQTAGSTPWQTMKSKLSTDILSRGDRSPFMRSDKGRFALREWNARIPEHVADRYQRALFDEDVLVFPAERIGEFIRGVGLHPVDSHSGDLSKACYPVRRRTAEEDTSVIQLVSVFVVRCNEQLLTYKRTKRLPESRLHGAYSLYFGGHLNPDDVPPLFNILDAKQWLPWLVRELNEEVGFDRGLSTEVAFRGLLYDDSRPVSKQHLGVVYEVRVSNQNFRIGERGFLMDAKYETIGAIRERISEFENWSVVILDSLEAGWG